MNASILHSTFIWKLYAVNYHLILSRNIACVRKGQIIPALAVFFMTRRRQIEGSLNTARATAELLRSLITRKGHPDANALLSDVRTWGTQLQAAKPLGELSAQDCVHVPSLSNQEAVILVHTRQLYVKKLVRHCRTCCGQHRAPSAAHDPRGVSECKHPFT